jgi:hypothetical protein
MAIRTWRDIERQRRLAFLVGAGASRLPPAGLPTAAEYTHVLLATVAGADPLLRSAVRRLSSNIWSGNPGCRLEVVLDLLREGRGMSALRLLDAFDQGTPNEIRICLPCV